MTGTIAGLLTALTQVASLDFAVALFCLQLLCSYYGLNSTSVASLTLKLQEDRMPCCHTLFFRKQLLTYIVSQKQVNSDDLCDVLS